MRRHLEAREGVTVLTLFFAFRSFRSLFGLFSSAACCILGVFLSLVSFITRLTGLVWCRSHDVAGDTSEISERLLPRLLRNYVSSLLALLGSILE
jgi:hypothetical protein